jgi:hypothetical protein
MTSFNTYIGDLDDPTFKWEGGNWDGNIPAGLSPSFPPYKGFSYVDLFLKWVVASGCEYKQTDWGAWVAKVTKKQIQEFISVCYGADESYTNEEKALRWQGKAYLVERLKSLTAFVDTLDETKLYALVATET